MGTAKPLVNEKFLLWRQFLFDAGQGIVAFKNELKTHFATAGWSLVFEGPTVLRFRPPATTQLGSIKGYSTTEFNFTSTSDGNGDFLKICSRIQFGISQPYKYRFVDEYYYPADGSPNPYVPVLFFDGVRKEFNTGQAYPNRRARTMALYQMLVASNDPEVKKFNYEFIDLTPNDVASGYVSAEYIGSGPMPVVTSLGNYWSWGNINIAGLQISIKPGDFAQHSMANPDTGIKINYLTGFVYYLSIGERYAYICTKDSTQTYGPLMSIYTDHDEAVKFAPDDAIPVEHYTGRIYDSGWARYAWEPDRGFLTSAGYDRMAPSHYLGRAQMLTYGYLDNYYWPLFNRNLRDYPRKIEEFMTPSSYGNIPIDYWGYASFNAPFGYHYPFDANQAPAVYGAQGFTIPMYFNATNEGRNLSSYVGVSALSVYTPGGYIPGIKGLAKVASNEGLYLVQQDMYNLTVTGDVAADGTSIPVADTTGWPTAGTLRINGENIVYSSITPTSFEGCQRGRFNTVGTAITTGSILYLSMWFVTFNKMAIPAGYLRP